MPIDQQAPVAGAEPAFATLVNTHRRELQVHCYRMLGSFEDSEDLVQETFLRAWRKRGSFQGRASVRSWLYRIATNACLDWLERHPRAPRRDDPALPVIEVPWLQPYPDRLLDGIPAADDDPEAAVVARETIELAFIAAIQLLPPRQRAVLIARDVLAWSAAECALLLDLSVPAVNSALQRARATLRRHVPPRLDWAPDADATAAEQALVRRYVEATDRNDAAGLAALLREDARFSMPPDAAVVHGRDTMVASWVEGGFGMPDFGTLRGVATRVNRQPAVACYRHAPGDDAYRPLAIDVLSIEAGSIVEIVMFPLEPLVDALGLPTTMEV